MSHRGAKILQKNGTGQQPIEQPVSNEKQLVLWVRYLEYCCRKAVAKAHKDQKEKPKKSAKTRLTDYYCTVAEILRETVPWQTPTPNRVRSRGTRVQTGRRGSETPTRLGPAAGKTESYPVRKQRAAGKTAIWRAVAELDPDSETTQTRTR